MDHLLAVRVVQGSGDLFHIGHCRFEGQAGTARMKFAERPMRGVVHSKERRALLYCEVEHMHDMRMVQASERLGFNQELVYIRVLE